ncbi:MAG TPA: alpha-L-fucosidase [Acidimicrobiales bacterium]|nr:alpha-L-fucosidase [Acidimicrobiales bacterium]
MTQLAASAGSADPGTAGPGPAGLGWFRGAGLGLFVHWGHSSQQGLELSWPMAGGTAALPFSHAVPVADYQASAATFSPEPGAAREWARLARGAGMTYAVLTTRHHDGYSKWPSEVSDFCSARDQVGEIVEACRAEGLRVGLYYSLSDWHHPDYPALTDDDRPYAFQPRRPGPEAWARYLEYLFAQVRELLTRWGRIDLLWFDGGWERSAAEWRTRDLHDLIRSLQPDVVVNDRLPGFGDYETPEQFVPPQPPDGPWETCMTMNSTWGWCPDDTGYKSGRELVHTLCEVAGRGGNLLLNVSPRGDGSLPPTQVERLEGMARWMAAHRDAVAGTTPGLEPWQFYGPSTRRGDRVYLHLLWRPYDTVTVRGIPVKRVRGVRVLGSGAALEWTSRCTVLDTLFNADPVGEITIAVPAGELDDDATIVEITVGTD